MTAMKAVIMAAGEGKRMRPLTHNIPKPLIEINGKPFLYYLIKNIMQSGIKDIGIVVGYKSEMIKKFLDENRIKATLIQQDKQRGTGHAVSVCRHFVGTSEFITVNGDDLYSEHDIRRMQIPGRVNYIAGFEHNTPEKYGVLMEENGFLKEIIEKPTIALSKIVNTGLYKFTPEIFQALSYIRESERGELELTDAVTLLAKQKKVKVLRIRGYWLGIGCREDIKRVSKIMIEKNIV
ncbi:sugar phosphate nucleotidyltransferase [Candidatus Aenigmatarchaeota archaeon]